MCQDPRKIRDLDASWIMGWHFVEGSRGSWILSTQFLLDSVDLGYCLEKLLLDHGDPGSGSEKIHWLRCIFNNRINIFDGRCGSLELVVKCFL